MSTITKHDEEIAAGLGRFVGHPFVAITSTRYIDEENGSCLRLHFQFAVGRGTEEIVIETRDDYDKISWMEVVR